MPSSEFFKTIDPYLYNVNLYYNKDYYKSFTNYYKVLVYGIDTLKYFIEYNKSKELNSTITTRADLYKQLDSGGMDEYQQIQYKIYWYEKFFRDFDIIKQQFYKEVTSPVYFKEISDSIGLLRNYYCVPDDSTLFVKDTDFQVQQSNNIPVPIGVGSSVYNKLRTNTVIVTTQLNFLNTILYRHNVSNIQNNFTYPNQAHGDNLVPDFFHIEKMKNISNESLEKSLRSYYGKLYELILFYENFNYGDYEKNLAKMEKGAIEINIENVTKKIDYLQQEVTGYVDTVNLYSRLAAQAVG